MGGGWELATHIDDTGKISGRILVLNSHYIGEKKKFTPSPGSYLQLYVTASYAKYNNIVSA